MKVKLRRTRQVEPLSSTGVMNLSYNVRILLIESDKGVQEAFCHKVNSAVKTPKVAIDICDGQCIEEKGYWDSGKAYDLYVCGKYSNDMLSVLDFIKAVKLRDYGATIFVLSDDPDPVLLKKILKMNVEGMIDRDDMDLSLFLRELEMISETYVKVSHVAEKFNKLAALKSDN